MKYRTLGPGEVLREGDEVWLQEQEWVKTKYPGKRVDNVHAIMYNY